MPFPHPPRRISAQSQLIPPMENAQISADLIRDRLGTAAFAFRGYNTTNLGRSAELLGHPRLWPGLVERFLREASEVCSEATGRQFDLVGRVRVTSESTLETFAEDIAADRGGRAGAHRDAARSSSTSSMPQPAGAGLQHGRDRRPWFAAASIEMHDLLRPLLVPGRRMRGAGRRTSTMGVLFSRGPALDFDAVQRLCLEITAEGRGRDRHLGATWRPTRCCCLGKATRSTASSSACPTRCGEQVHLRKNHAPLAAVAHAAGVAAQHSRIAGRDLMQTMPGGFRRPDPPVLSLVTGKVSYNDFNSREILNRWIDHPQRLWDAIYETAGPGRSNRDLTSAPSRT